MGQTDTGVKLLEKDGYTFKAFCVYNADGTGWFFPSRQAVTDNSTFTLNLEDQYDSRDKAAVRVFFDDGTQKDSILEQLSTHPSRWVNMIYMYIYSRLGNYIGQNILGGDLNINLSSVVRELLWV